MLHCISFKIGRNRMVELVVKMQQEIHTKIPRTDFQKLFPTLSNDRCVFEGVVNENISIALSQNSIVLASKTWAQNTKRMGAEDRVWSVTFVPNEETPNVFDGQVMIDDACIGRKIDYTLSLKTFLPDLFAKLLPALEKRRRSVC